MGNSATFRSFDLVIAHGFDLSREVILDLCCDRACTRKVNTDYERYTVDVGETYATGFVNMEDADMQCNDGTMWAHLRVQSDSGFTEWEEFKGTSEHELATADKNDPNDRLCGRMKICTSSSECSLGQYKSCNPSGRRRRLGAGEETLSLMIMAETEDNALGLRGSKSN